MTGPIAVTGASGRIGGRVARLLARGRIDHRLIVRDSSRMAEHHTAEVARVSGYGAASSMRAALDGIATLLLVPAPAAVRDRVGQQRVAVEAAAAAGVDRIVYLSFIGADPAAIFTLARDHWHTEQHIRQSGLGWTFLRMSLFIDFIPSMVLADGTLRGPAGGGKLAAVHRDDVAAAAAAAATSTGHEARIYDLTGPECFSFAQAARSMSWTTGKAIRFVDQADEEAFESRRAPGVPEDRVADWVSSYQAIRAGELDGVSDDVRALTGRDPVSLGGFLRANPDVLRHVMG